MTLIKGYFAGCDNYAEWHEMNRAPVPCDYCRKAFHPTAPANKHCQECLPIYRHDQWRDSLSRNGFIRKICGMTPAEYIAEYGQESYDSL